MAVITLADVGKVASDIKTDLDPDKQLSPAYVEDYIKNLKWSDDTPDTIRTYVIGNLRGFAQAARIHLNLKSDN